MKNKQEDWKQKPTVLATPSWKEKIIERSRKRHGYEHFCVECQKEAISKTEEHLLLFDLKKVHKACITRLIKAKQEARQEEKKKVLQQIENGELDEELGDDIEIIKAEIRQEAINEERKKFADWLGKIIEDYQDVRRIMPSIHFLLLNKQKELKNG